MLQELLALHAIEQMQAAETQEAVEALAQAGIAYPPAVDCSCEVLNGTRQAAKDLLTQLAFTDPERILTQININENYVSKRLQHITARLAVSI